MRYLPFSVVLVVCLFVGGLTKTKDEWTTRTIYQVLTDRYLETRVTDRFAKGDGSKGNCDLHDYCGGNYQGLINNLDYIISNHDD
jgi:alpha-amylase